MKAAGRAPREDGSVGALMAGPDPRSARWLQVALRPPALSKPRHRLREDRHVTSRFRSRAAASPRAPLRHLRTTISLTDVRARLRNRLASLRRFLVAR